MNTSCGNNIFLVLAFQEIALSNAWSIRVCRIEHLHVHLVEIIVSKSRIAFRTFPLASIVPRFQTVDTKDVETFRQDGIFRTRVTNGTHQFSLRKIKIRRKLIR